VAMLFGMGLVGTGAILIGVWVADCSQVRQLYESVQNSVSG